MTYQEKYSELQRIVAEKGKTFQALDKEIRLINGFADGHLLSSHQKAFSELRVALENYNKVIGDFMKNKAHPEDEFPEN